MGEVTTSYSGGTPNVSNCEYYGDEIPFIRSGEINNRHTDLFITEKGLLNSSAAMVKEGDILYALYGATSGEVSRSKLKGAINQAILAILPKTKYDSEYIAQWLKIKKRYIVDTYLQGGQGNLSGNIVKNFIVDFSSYNEQLNIGNLASSLDHLITLHQSKSFWYILKSIVSCTLYWEQRKLGELMNVISVKRIHQSDWSTEGVRFLRARDIVADYKHEEVEDLLYISQEKYEECSALVGKVAIDDMLVTGVGTIGIPYLIKDLTPLYFKDGNIIWFQNNGKIQGDFFYYSFTAAQIQNFIKDSAGIGTVGTYTIESGKKTPILLPSEAEQNKIGQFFKDLDNLITLHQLEPYNLIFKAIAYRIIDYAKSKPPKCIK